MILCCLPNPPPLLYRRSCTAKKIRKKKNFYFQILSPSFTHPRILLSILVFCKNHNLALRHPPLPPSPLPLSEIIKNFFFFFIELNTKTKKHERVVVVFFLSQQTGILIIAKSCFARIPSHHKSLPEPNGYHYTKGRQRP